MNNGNMNNINTQNLSPLPGARQPMLPPHMFMAPSPGFVPPSPLFMPTMPNMFGFGVPKQSATSNSPAPTLLSGSKTVSDLQKEQNYGAKIEQKSTALILNERYQPLYPDSERTVLFEPKSLVHEETAITLYKSESKYWNGNLIAANSNYLCYVVKGIMIRVLSLNSKTRGLLKGHKEQDNNLIRDLQFAPNRDVLCSVDYEGKIFVWDLTVSPSRPGKEPELIGTILCQWKGTTTPATRVLWDSHKFWIYVASPLDKSLQIWDLSGVATSHETHQLLASIHSEDISDISSCEYSPSNPKSGSLYRLIAIGCGPKVSLWLLEQSQSSNNVQTTQLDSFFPFTLSPTTTTSTTTTFDENDVKPLHTVQSLALIPRMNDDNQTTSTPALVVGLNSNTIIKTFKLTLSWGMANVECQSSLEFHGAEPKTVFANHFYVSPNNRFIFVTNMCSSVIYILKLDHLFISSIWGVVTGDTNISASAISGRNENIMLLYCLQLNTIALYQLPTSDFVSPSATLSTTTTTTTTTTMSSANPLSTLQMSGNNNFSPSSPTSALKKMLSVGVTNPSTLDTTTTIPTTTAAETGRAAASTTSEEPSSTETKAPNVMEILHRAILKRSMEVANPPLVSVLGSTNPPPPSHPPGLQHQYSYENVKSVEATTTTTTTTTPAAPLATMHQDSKHLEDSLSKVEHSSPDNAMTSENRANATSENPQNQSDEELLSVPLQLEKKIPKTGNSNTNSPGPGPGATKPEKKKEPKKTKKKDVGVEGLLTSEDIHQQSAASNSTTTSTTNTTTTSSTAPATSTTTTSTAAQSQQSTAVKLKKKKEKKPEASSSLSSDLLKKDEDSSAATTTTNTTTINPTTTTNNNSVQQHPALSPSTSSSGTTMNGATIMDQLLTLHMERLYQRLETERKEREKAERTKQEKLLTAISTTVNNTMTSAIENAVRNELSTAVVPALTKNLVQIIEQSLMKPLQETLKKSVTQAMTSVGMTEDKKQNSTVQKAVQESFEKSFIPQVSSSVAVMFQQIAKSFDEGLNKRFDDLQSKELSRINQISQSLQKTVSDAISDLPKATTIVSQSTSSQPPSTTMVTSTSKKSNTNETVVVKPPNTQELYATVKKLLDTKNYEEGFSVTLTARNLELLSKVCASNDPQVVLRSGSLSMATILCLVQQLGFDLSTDLALKLSWLNESLVQVDSKEKTASQHAPKILQKLKQNLEKVNSSSLPSPVSFQLKLTLHLINSLLNAKA